MPRGGVDLEVGGGVCAAHHVPGHAGVHALVTLGHRLDLVNIRQARAARGLQAGTGEALCQSRGVLDALLYKYTTRLRVDKDKPKGWFKGNWKGDYSKLCYFGQL